MSRHHEAGEGELEGRQRAEAEKEVRKQRQAAGVSEFFRSSAGGRSEWRQTAIARGREGEW